MYTMASNYTRRITIWINGKEVQNDIASIRNELTKLTNKQAHMNMDSSEYKQAAKEIQRVNNILAIHRNELKATATGWGRLKSAAESMNRYFLMISSAVAGFGGALMAGKKAISMYAEFDDKVADVKRTTGMTRDEIYAMNEELKKVNTRTAQLELMGLGVVAGKLGIAKNDVEGFIRAADKITVAMGGALGTNTEEAINQIGKLVDIFKLKDKFGIEEALLKVGSGLVDLGNASTASEGYIVEFAKRVGGVAPTVGVSIEAVMGLAATLDQLGQTSEVSSTVYSAMITGMFKKTGEYAKIAGMNVKGFSSLLKKDTNEAFIKVLEGLKGTNGGMERLVALMGDIGMDGKRSASVLGVLSNNTELLRGQQDLVNKSMEKGTIIQGAFNSKNSSAQAVLDKARKNMDNLAVELGEKLLPALTVSTNGFSYFVKFVSVATDFVFKHTKAIFTITAALVAYGIVTKATTLLEGLRIGTISKGLILSNLEVVAIKLKILLTGQCTAAQRAAIMTNQALNASMKASIWGLVAAGIVMATMAIIEWVKNANKASAAQEAVNRAREKSVEMMVEERSKVDILVSLINSENVSMAGKKKAIEDLQKIIPGYTAMLDAQGKVIYQNTQKVQDYIAQLTKQYMLQAYQEEFGKANMDYAKAQDKKDQAIATYNTTMTEKYKPGTPRLNNGSAKGQLSNAILDADQEVKDSKAIVDALANKVASSLNALDNTKEKIAEARRMMVQIFDTMNSTAKDENGNLVITAAAKAKMQIELDAWRKKYLFLTGQNKKKNTPVVKIVGTETENAPPEDIPPAGGDDAPDNKSKKAEEKRLNDIEDAYKQQQDIKKQAIERSIALMQEGSDKELAVLQEKFITEREAIAHELDTNTLLTVEQKKLLNDSLIDLQEGYNKSEETIYKEKALKELKYQKTITDLKLEGVKAGSEEEYRLRKQLLDQQMAIDIAEVTGTEEQKAQVISLIKLKYAKKQAKEDQEYGLKFLDDKLKEDIRSLTDGETKKENDLKQKRAEGKLSLREYHKELKKLQQEYSVESLRISLEKAERELAIMKAAGEDVTDLEKFIADQKLKIERGDTGGTTTDDVKGKSFKDMSEDPGAIKDYAVEQAQVTADALFQIERDKNQRILDEKLNALETQRNAELSNKNLTEAQKDAINKKYDAKARAIKKADWEKQHRADIIQAIVSTALAVIKAAPSVPLMIAAGVAGAASIAVISAQKAPEFYEGGYTATSSDSRRPAGVVHDNEYVVPEEGLKNPRVRAILNQIEIARVNKSLPMLNPMIDWKQSRQMFAGGFSTQTSSATSAPVFVQQNTTDPAMVAIIRENTEAMKQMRDELAKGVKGKWVLNDFEKIQNNKSNIQSATEM